MTSVKALYPNKFKSTGFLGLGLQHTFFVGHSFVHINMICLSCLVLFCFFLGPCLRHMEVFRLGVSSKLQLPAYATATPRQDPNCVCDLHHSSQQCQIPNPPSKARDRTRILIDISWLHVHCATMGTPRSSTYNCLFHETNPEELNRGLRSS